MGLFENAIGNLKANLNREISKQIKGAVDGAVRRTINNANLKKEKFVFTSLPASVDSLKSLPEADLDSAFKTAALTVAVLCNYEKNPEGTFAMLDVLKGPEPTSNMEKNQIKDRLTGKYYIPFSFFEGATTDNGYTPTTPYTITVYQNPYSFSEDNWATMYVRSAGADSDRPIRLRKKPSTGQWFLNGIQCLAGIRIPKAEDKWA